MALDPRTPVIVGVGQFLHRAGGLEDAWEPAALMEEAVGALWPVDRPRQAHGR